MVKINYYKEIKNILINNEVYKKVKDYSKNKSDLNSYFQVGRLLVEAQGGEVRAKYGNKLIKEYSDKLTKELGRGYSVPNLKRMRKFYLIFEKAPHCGTFSDNLSWTHYRVLLKLKNIDEIKYYIYITEVENLSYRELHERIQMKEYERVGFKEELKEPKINTLIKNPIIIKANNINKNITEKVLHNLIIEDLPNFLKELGVGFLYYGHEVKIKIGDNYHYIDFLLFNYKYNCFIVLEMKVTKMKAEYIGQVKKYINYVDKHIKEAHNDSTVGVIIIKKEDKYIIDYCSDNRIFTTTYELNSIYS